MRKIKFALILVILGLVNISCTETMDRLKNVGRTPDMSAVDIPMYQGDYREVEWDEEENQPADTRKTTNSLWQAGSRTFFRDQRARRVGDILKVVVKFKDKATFDNKTSTSRNTSETLAAPAALGLSPFISGILPGKQTFSNLLSINGNNSHEGDGSIEREEELQTEIAAMVTQILPNGNLVIKGKQEIRVNNEVREVKVAGIIRSEDISANNSITTDQIAEARISYGGRGKVTDIQKPRLGSEIIDIISPF